MSAFGSSFTDWEDGLSMQRVNKEGIWELLIESDKPLEGEFYKYRVVGKNGQAHMKADPYAFESETLKKTASIIPRISEHQWKDSAWLKKRSATVCPKQRGI